MCKISKILLLQATTDTQLKYNDNGGKMKRFKKKTQLILYEVNIALGWQSGT